MRKFSRQTIAKYIRQLQSGASLSIGELRAIKRALNFSESPNDIQALLMGAENCNCPTPKGTLIGFDSQYSMDLGTEFIPKFKTGE